MGRYGWLRRSRAFLRYLWRRFLEAQCLLWAGSLAYSTLLACVPLTVVAYAGFSAFPVFTDWWQQLQDFVFRNFVPATGETVRRALVDFAEKAKNLSSVGLAALVVTALLLVSQIEAALSQIWRVRTPRSLPSRVVVYWAALTFGPLLIGASLATTSYLISLPLVRGAAATGVGRLALELVPVAIEVFAFTLAYIVVPNVSVPWRPALMGGTLAALLFELAKRGFGFYVSQFPSYEVLYGALAAVPLFLLWIFLSWVVILLGAAFAAALHAFRAEAQLAGWRERQELLLAYRLIGHLWRAQRDGEGRSFDQLRDDEPAAAAAQLDRLLRRLAEAKLIRQGRRGEWLLSRDPAETTLLDLYRSGNFTLPAGSDLSDLDADSWNQALSATLEPLEGALRQHLSRPMKQLFVEPRPVPSGVRLAAANTADADRDTEA